jgi:hypothetical protein
MTDRDEFHFRRVGGKAVYICGDCLTEMADSGLADENDEDGEGFVERLLDLWEDDNE